MPSITLRSLPGPDPGPIAGRQAVSGASSASVSLSVASCLVQPGGGGLPVAAARMTAAPAPAARRFSPGPGSASITGSSALRRGTPGHTVRLYRRVMGPLNVTLAGRAMPADRVAADPGADVVRDPVWLVRCR